MEYPNDFIDRALRGDCMEIMPLIPSQSIDMILCDLPYGITNRNKWDEIIPMSPLWSEYKRIIKPNGVIVLTSWGMFSAKLMVSATVKYQYSMVWCKPNRIVFTAISSRSVCGAPLALGACETGSGEKARGRV